MASAGALRLSAGLISDLIGPAQLPDLLLQFGHPGALVAVDSGVLASLDLFLDDPPAQCLAM